MVRQERYQDFLGTLRYSSEAYSPEKTPLSYSCKYPNFSWHILTKYNLSKILPSRTHFTHDLYPVRLHFPLSSMARSPALSSRQKHASTKPLLSEPHRFKEPHYITDQLVNISLEPSQTTQIIQRLEAPWLLISPRPPLPGDDFPSFSPLVEDNDKDEDDENSLPRSMREHELTRTSFMTTESRHHPFYHSSS